MPLVVVVLLAWSASAWSWSDADEERYQHWVQELRCLVCQNQTIADSHAPLAKDLRKQVRSMIDDGASDAQIQRYMTDRYGDFVLYRPPFKPLTWALWLGPFVILLVAVGVALSLRRTAQREPGEAEVDVAEVDQAELQRILERRR